MKRTLKRYQTPRNGIQYIVNQNTRTELSPFMFFDAGTMQRNDEGLFIGYHPHSGIGIITYFDGADLDHGDTGDNDGIIKSGGIQWIRAGGGAWHQEHYKKRPEETAATWQLDLHQLWLLLPPELEESDVEYQNVQPGNVPVVDNVKVVTGTYKGVTSPLKTPYNMTYLDVSLKQGDVFNFQTPEKQTTGFVFPRTGAAQLFGDGVPLNKLSVLAQNEGAIEITAQADTKFVLIMAEPYDYPVIPHGGSIHTSYEAIERSMHRIQKAAELAGK